MGREDTLTRTGIIAGLIGLGLLAFNLWTHDSVVDDAYISFRYLDNWLDGDGLVYNEGERVEGYTNFLWIVLLAPLRYLGLAPETGSLVLSLGALAALLWAVFRTALTLDGSAEAGWAAVILLSGSVQVASWTTSGMETLCFAAFIAVANQRLACRMEHTASSSLGFGLAVLTRPNGLLHAFIAFAAAFCARPNARPWRQRHLWWPAIVFLAFPGGHLLFRWFYYGYPLPNTFYAKLGGDTPNLAAAGLSYTWGFLLAGGSLLVLAALLVVFVQASSRNWVLLAIGGQAVGHLAYVVWIGGDYFPFHRFVVPVIPNLAVLGGVGLVALVRRFRPRHTRWVPQAALLLAVAQTALARASTDETSFTMLIPVREGRELVAEWIQTELANDTVVAINAAGLIPYRTKMRTIDMLGLNDLHIARAGSPSGSDGTMFVGHFKHDGRYVCSRAPDVVLTGGASLHRGRSTAEATMQAAANTFPGDREFLRECGEAYTPVAEELRPGRYVVVYLRDSEAEPTSPELTQGWSAEEWFVHGVQLMGSARFEQAIDAFERSLRLNPGHPAALTNLGFCLFDLQRFDRAAVVFTQALERDAHHFEALYGLAATQEKRGRPEEAMALWERYLSDAPASTWKDRAREHLARLRGQQ